MEYLYKRWEAPRCWFGDFTVLAFILVQSLDGALTYVGVSFWGLAVEANPIISSAVQVVGLGAGLAAAKLIAAGLGVALHLHRAHALVGLLTILYVAGAILPWTALFLTN